MDVKDLLASLGIHWHKTTGAGRHKSTCPKCSHLRKKRKTAPCLYITEKPKGVKVHCFHCSYEDYVPYDQGAGYQYVHRTPVRNLYK